VVENLPQDSREDADIRTVAALRGLYRTVSRTINAFGSQRPSCQRVWRAIEQLNYFPTPMRAAGLVAAASSASLLKTSPILLSRADPEL